MAAHVQNTYHPLVFNSVEDELKSNQRYETLHQLAKITTIVATAALVAASCLTGGLYWLPIVALTSYTLSRPILNLVKYFDHHQAFYHQQVGWNRKVIDKLENIPSDQQAITDKLQEYRIAQDRWPENFQAVDLRRLLAELECDIDEIKKFHQQEEELDILDNPTLEGMHKYLDSRFKFRHVQWECTLDAAYHWHLLNDPTTTESRDELVKRVWSEKSIALTQFFANEQDIIHRPELYEYCNRDNQVNYLTPEHFQLNDNLTETISNLGQMFRAFRPLNQQDQATA